MRLLLVFLLLVSLYATAKEKKQPKVVTTTVPCFKLDAILKELNIYGEEPIFLGKSSLEKNVVTAVYVNQETGSYTVIEVGKNVGCVLSVGENMQYRMPKNMTGADLL